MVGETVYSAKDENVGEIQDVAVKSDEIYAIIGVGGFLGIGEHDVAVPFDEITLKGNRIKLKTLSESQLDNKPEYKYSDYTIMPVRRSVRSSYEQRDKS